MTDAVFTLCNRLKLAIEANTEQRGRYSWLEAKTGIPAATWRTWWTRGAVPSGNLLEAVSRMWPHYAFWLATGCTDEHCGHVSPISPELDTEFSQAYLKALLAAPAKQRGASNPQGTAALGALAALSARRGEEILSILRDGA